MIHVTRRRVVAAAAALLAAAIVYLLVMPTTTLQGVNYKITAYHIPAYVKAIDFLQRHFDYQIQVERICGGMHSQHDCVLAIFDWTHDNIPRTPPGWKIVDDHPLNIIIRGHGMSDQIADVFATLSTYAGAPGFIRTYREPGPDRQLELAFVQLDGAWRVFDVERHIAFRNRSGALASIDDLLGDQALIDEQTRGLRVADVAYTAIMNKAHLAPFVVPNPLRTQMQQPWPRLRHELARAIGLARG